MFRFSIVALLAATLLSAQDPSELFHKPPADVDKALRARISEFFELHVKGDFRRAEALVAEDTKDYFYDNNKPRYLSFEISHIKYNDDFTRAQVTVMCEQYVRFPGFPNTPMKVPTPSTWKIENGQWVWYVDQSQLGMSPMGIKMTPGPPSKAGAPPALGSIPTLEQFYASFKADRDSVTLQPGGGAEEILISNTSPGSMTVHVLGELAGVEAKFEHTMVMSGDKAVLRLRALPGAKSGTIEVRIDPLGKIIPIQVSLK
ncbi:MAG TPA: hypothetical protein VKB88_02900 [Bryobacteraceae bacterium]|nr:hypothetical protein [Bryobacteraceae bacterium]